MMTCVCVCVCVCARVLACLLRWLAFFAAPAIGIWGQGSSGVSDKHGEQG